ncbi:GTP-binding protein [Arthrobacter sp. NPDC080073]|uniref:CobW family GTP-binding protein n=1 Tax=Arthrobacter sp. NPDC080073 TaxID=3155919 RepID=UPI0034345632
MSSTVPVVAVTGFLGAGKTTLVNHLLRHPTARVGVIVNDFGDINIDAGLVIGQVDEPVSIAGGCVCCLPDAGGLGAALQKLTNPKLDLDVILVEASGIADPVSLSRLIRSSGVERVRPGGVIDVVDALEYFHTVDTRPLVPNRFAAATLVVLNKTDRLNPQAREYTLARIAQRVHERNPHAHLVRARHGRIDPALVFDSAVREEPADELPIRSLLLEMHAEHDTGGHQHAEAVSAQSSGAIDAGRLLDLLENPPNGVYRIKGEVFVDSGHAIRSYLVNLVGRSIHIRARPASARSGLNSTSSGRRLADHSSNQLVAVGVHIDVSTTRARLQRALAPAEGPAAADGLRRLQRYRRLST